LPTTISVLSLTFHQLPSVVKLPLSRRHRIWTYN